MAKKQKQMSLGTKLGVSALLLVGLLIISSVIALFFTADTKDIGANTAIIQIKGPIMVDNPGGLFSGGVTESTEILKQLQKAKEDESITAVILEINSPGGSAVASDEIAQAIGEMNDKIVVSWVREIGASGAYWIASESDHIVTNRMSITGSIGVIGSYLGFEEFLTEWNLTYNRLVAGEKKDLGDPFQELTPAEQKFLQKKLDIIHEFFIAEVAENRNLSLKEVQSLADGRFYLGVEAKEAGLVDELGSKKEAVAYIENVTGEKVKTTTYAPKKGFWEILFSSLGSSNRNIVQKDFVPALR